MGGALAAKLLPQLWRSKFAVPSIPSPVKTRGASVNGDDTNCIR